MTTSMRKYSSILFLTLSLSLVIQPINFTANAFDSDDPVADARMHAAGESGGTWFMIGCVGGLIGYIIAAAVTPTPPATALVGKDEAYVATFSDTYASEVQSSRKSNAMYGCLVGTGVSVLAYVALIAAAENAN